MARIAANLVFFSIAVVLVKIVGTLTTFLVARILSPGDFGIWVTLLAVGSFSSIICLGTVEALIKFYPYLVGKGELEEARLLERGVLGSIVVAAAVLVAGGATAHLFVGFGLPQSLVNIIRIMAGALAMGMFSAFFYHRFMAHQDFRFVSIIDSLRSVSLFVLIVPLSWKWGLVGAVAAIMLNEVVVLSYSFFTSNQMLGAIRPSFSPSAIRKLIVVGFPITIIWWTYMFQSTVDRFLTMSMFGKEATGYYGLGASFVGTLVLIPMVVGRVLYPKVNEEIGKNGSREELWSYVILPAQILAITLPLVIGTLIIFVPDLYRLVFTKYLRGAGSAQILLLGVYFVCLIRSGVNYLVAIDKQNNVLGMVVASLGVNVGISVFLVKLGMNIEGISIGMSVSGFVLTTLLWKSVFKQLGFSLRSQVVQLFQLYLPFLLCLVLVGTTMALGWSAPRVSPLLIHSGAAATFVVLYGVSVFLIPPLASWSKNIVRRIWPILLPASTWQRMLSPKEG